ncbi:ATP-binding protein [Gordonia bronchialis]|uniref:ATP-binding protein n=1 Tax=Gordonia bronchialis TaxID=2054 RepID=UPI0022703A1E|nr:ATP-binding protein [Gordonia bronchialis]
MAETSMANFRCWNAESVARTVFSDIGGLAGDADAIFLAAHTPVELEHRKGAESGSVGSGEAQVLAALTNRIGDLERNTLVAVTGASGSGKSHVVRWVHSRLDRKDERFHVLYVPRAVQTLRELLRRIIEGLPGVVGSDLMDRVDAAISNVRPGEFQERLINEIKVALTWTIEDQAAFDGETEEEAAEREDRNAMLGFKDEASGGREAGLAELIDLPQIKQTLLRPDGRLSQLVKSYFDETSRRDENDGIFTRDDLPLKVAGIRSALRGRRELADLWTVIQRQPDDALKLLEEALRVALPRTVGLRSPGGSTLDSLFRESRRALRAQGQDLVLIFEDLAQFGLVDGELYDQFVTQPGSELAPLRVVFAITDAPYGRMERTVRTRIEHEFHIGGSALTHPPQFISRYLNLVRVGREETQRRWNPESGERDFLGWMANACDSREQGQPCRFRDRCHSAFGSVAVEGLGEVGLYPYNEHALARSFTEANERAAREGRPVTPRDVIQLSVEEVLTEADANITNGTYPHARTREQFDFKVRTPKDALLAANPSSDPERNYRALVIWGGESPLHAGVLQAFSLDARAATPKPPSPTPTQPQPPDLANPLLPLFQWQNGERLPEDDVDVYRRALHDLVLDRLGLDQYLVHIFKGRGQEILREIFNVTSFNIEGARGRAADPTKSVRFAIKPTREDVRILVATRWFRDHGHFDISRPKWQWPEGYEPAELLVELETRLDEWAGAVRERMLARTGGSRLAQQAIGVRAIALAAAGVDIASLGSAASVLASNIQGHVRADEAWQAADTVATRVVATLKVEESIGDFAAVRQGETGQPQLVEPRELDKAIADFLKAPKAALRQVSASTVDPTIAQNAKVLLDALEEALPNTVTLAKEAHSVALTLLEGHTPAQVGRLAEEVGTTARDEGSFFRPADKFREFRQAIDVLDLAPVPDADLLQDETLGAVVRQQKSIREAGRLAEALAFVKDVMAETKKEAERSGTRAGDISTLQASVKSQLTELSTLAKSLSSGGRE